MLPGMGPSARCDRASQAHLGLLGGSKLWGPADALLLWAKRAMERWRRGGPDAHLPPRLKALPWKASAPGAELQGARETHTQGN